MKDVNDRQQGLYRSEFEHDACGVGMVADVENRPSHDIVLKGLTVLKRLMHRGATGNDPRTGDGAGLLMRIPDAFFRKTSPNGRISPKKISFLRRYFYPIPRDQKRIK